MKNYVQPGDMITITAAAALLSGDGVLQGTLFGVAAGDIANGAEGEIQTVGVFTLPKIGAQAWTVGAAIYWDATNLRCTTTATGNTLIGKAVVAVGSGAGEIVGTVRLDG